MNVQTGEIRPWDSLTEEQQKSGEWIKLPTHDENGVAMAKHQPGAGILDQLFGPKGAAANRLPDALRQPRRFDATGKPVP